jgi:hypothetical protein
MPFDSTPSRRRLLASATLHPSMPSRTTIIAIAAVIAIPLIFAAAGATQAAGLALGVILVVIGVGWTLLGSRPTDPDDD